VTSAQAGIGLALVAALMANLASLLKHRGCQRVAPVQIGRPLRSARSLARSRWFAAGWIVAAAAWMVHVAALSMAPISLVQAVLAGGAVSLAVMSQQLFGNRVARRQWLALCLGGAGLAVLAITVPRFHGSHSDFSGATILAFEGGLALLAGCLALGHRSERLAARRGILQAALAGILFAVAGVAIKGLTGAQLSDLPHVAPWVATALVCGALAQYTAVAALQKGEAVETIGTMGLVANATQIAGGFVVFGDPLPGDPAGAAVQLGAFAMICVSALLLPGRNESAAQPAVKALA
jgi:drug/metabolite transporter (DMT)-like permease